MTLKEKGHKIWEALKPSQKRTLIIVGVLIAIVILAVAFYKSTHNDAKLLPKEVNKKREIALDKGTLEKSLYNEASKQDSKNEEQMKKMMAALKDMAEGRKPNFDEDELQTDLKSAIKPKPVRFPNARNIDPSGKTRDFGAPELSDIPEPNIPGDAAGGTAGAARSGGKVPVPGVPNSRSAGSVGLPPGVPPAPGQRLTQGMGAPAIGGASEPRPDIYGDIETVSQRTDKEKPESKKKDLKKIYLPPSFMEATLLSGMYAPTSEGGKGSPMPALIRIKNLAILPNSVRGDLKGCFIIAEAYGSLADERAHVRVNTLSCISKGGQAVIDQKIKGYAVDEDGFVGLRGNVVSKMGAALARSLLAGFAVGFGDAMNSSTITSTTSGLGVTQSYDTDQATRAGVGKGIAQAGKDLQKMLMDLGKQAYPVVEVGTGRKLTVVISEGVELEVKDRPNTCFGGGDKCVN